MLQVHLEQVGHPTLPPKGDEEVYLLRRHVLAGILPCVEEPEQRTEHGAVHPGRGELYNELRGEGASGQQQVLEVGAAGEQN